MTIMNIAEPLILINGAIPARSVSATINHKGQTVVEFTLIFVLFVVVAWVPADFGLAFYTSQLALNATRDGARIAAADKGLAEGTISCVLPCAIEKSSNPTGPLAQIAGRMSEALLPGATVSLTLPPRVGTACDRLVTVTITGNYNFWFYQVFRLMGGVQPNFKTITQSTGMMWEYQC